MKKLAAIKSSRTFVLIILLIALILLVGLLVAVILVAMYLPMFRLGGIMG